eukprot:scaffold8065_cov267-Pinguiococcus_pyrenoidosus.AAC.14
MPRVTQIDGFGLGPAGREHSLQRFVNHLRAASEIQSHKLPAGKATEAHVSGQPDEGLVLEELHRIAQSEVRDLNPSQICGLHGGAWGRKKEVASETRGSILLRCPSAHSVRTSTSSRCLETIPETCEKSGLGSAGDALEALVAKVPLRGMQPPGRRSPLLASASRFRGRPA